MIGILNEKPSQAKNFAKALGGMRGKFDGEDYVIVPAHGHLYGFIPDPSKQVVKNLHDKYASWDIDNLPWLLSDFQWKYGMKEGAKSTLQQIQKVLSPCDEIVLATDDDPTGEGSLLGWEIISMLNLRAKKYTRMFFADESEKEIRKAFKNRKLLGTGLSCMYQDPDYKQALFRTKWDYLSMQWTRIAASCAPFGYMPRQGRLKSAMVRLVGDQLKAIDEYVRKPFYQVRFRDDHDVLYTSEEEPKFDKQEDAPIGQYHSSEVVCDEKKLCHQAPPKFMDLASLSALLAPRGIPAKTVLSTYQKMYEDKVVSYPRTEDKAITVEQFNELLPFVDAIAGLLHVDTGMLIHRTPRKTHVKKGMAHGANRPGTNVPSSLDALSRYGAGAQEIYVLLATNYLQTLCEDYEYERQTGYLKEYPSFKGFANVPKKPGWKMLVIDEEDMADEDASDRGLGSMADPFVFEGANKKPDYPTMRWLMKQLEKHDVGTGATRTSIYADVTNAQTKFPLLAEKRGRITMAENGLVSYALLPGTHIGSLDLTEKVLGQMKEVYDGKTDGEQYLEEIAQMVRDDVIVMQANRKNLDGLSLRNKAVKREMYACSSGPFAGKSFSRVWAQYVFSDEECEKLANGETILIDGAVSSKGRKFACRGKLEDQVYKGKSFFGFKMESLADSANPGVPASWCGHKFTKREQKALEAGKDVFVKGFVSRSGKKFDCFVAFKKDDEGKMRIVPDFTKKK